MTVEADRPTSGERMMLEPVTQQFIDSLETAGGPPTDTLSLPDARRLLARLQSRAVGKPAAQLEDLILPVGPTGTVGVRIIRPASAGDLLPAVIYLHGGGGGSLGDKDTHDRMVRELVVGAGAVFFVVEYARSPEARYPIAIEQAYAATAYVAQHGRSLKVDPSRLAIAGDGTGGNMAAAVTLMAKARRGPKIDLQVLFYPAVDPNLTTESYTTFANGPWLTKRAMESFWNVYLPDAAAKKEITAVPLNASIEELSGLPDALIIVAENDVVRDEGEAYAHRLSLAGVRVTSSRYHGTIHDFAMLNALADTPAARGAIHQANAILRSVLE